MSNLTEKNSTQVIHHISYGKAILFGEHAVVFGKPCIVLPLKELKTEIIIQRDERNLLNGKEITVSNSVHIHYFLNRIWNGVYPLSIIDKSSIPIGSGLGSSASVSVALTIANKALRNERFTKNDIARESYIFDFNVAKAKNERTFLSPADTSCITHEMPIYISGSVEKNFLWTIKKFDDMFSEERIWNVHEINIPADWNFIVVYSGIKKGTEAKVGSVRQLVHTEPEKREVVNNIEKLVKEAKKAIERNDKRLTGELMTENHEALRELGVSHEELEKIINKVKDCCYGAKLTGAGGGGSVIILTDDVQKCKKVLSDEKYRIYNV